MLQALPQIENDPDYPFIKAVYQCADGQPDELARMLRSETPLSEECRESLARLIEGRLKKPDPKRGRPRQTKLHEAALWSRMFYRDWREENRNAGVNDYGKSEWMKSESIRILIDMDQSFKGVDAVKVRDLMDR